MEPSKKKEFAVLTSLLLLTRIGDGISTYLASPDLTYELNPIESVLGAGWIGLFVANVICIGAIVYLNYFQLFVYNEPSLGDTKISTRREYLSVIYFNRPDKFIWFFYRLPKRWKPMLNQLGYVLPRMLIFMGIILIANNLMGAFRFQPYLTIMRMWQYSWVIIYLLGLVSAIPFFIKKVNIEYSQIISKG
jgi:hypothetical protein